MSFSTKLRSFASLATSTLTLLQLIGLHAGVAGAFDISANDNLVVYWGQNSYGATHPSDPVHWQQPIDYYCRDDTINMIPIAFLIDFNSTGGLPTINLANSCNGPFFPGTALMDCSVMASQIRACQVKGKAITMSLGGSASAPHLPDDEAGKAFAQIIWDLFLGGQSSTRPFGNAVLDGIDMDIEAGSQTGFVAFLTTLRSLMDADDKDYYITASPQCPYPDAWIGDTLNRFGFDAVFVQFYNNFCNAGTASFNFATWNDWATTISPNPNVKVYLGVPASPTAAGSGYLDAARLGAIIKETRSRYSSFGGVMLWDASQAYANGRYDVQVKKALMSGNDDATAYTTLGNCRGTSPWKANTVYLGGDKVTYDGHVWSAKWWSYDNLPRGAVNVWADQGACEAVTPLKSQIEEAAQSFIESFFHGGHYAHHY